MLCTCPDTDMLKPTSSQGQQQNNVVFSARLAAARKEGRKNCFRRASLEELFSPAVFSEVHGLSLFLSLAAVVSNAR